MVLGGLEAASCLYVFMGDWQTGQVTNTSYMFHEASSFTSDLSAWQTEVTDMSYMFCDAAEGCRGTLIDNGSSAPAGVVEGDIGLINIESKSRKRDRYPNQVLPPSKRQQFSSPDAAFSWPLPFISKLELFKRGKLKAIYLFLDFVVAANWRQFLDTCKCITLDIGFFLTYLHEPRLEWLNVDNKQRTQVTTIAGVVVTDIHKVDKIMETGVLKAGMVVSFAPTGVVTDVKSVDILLEAAMFCFGCWGVASLGEESRCFSAAGLGTGALPEEMHFANRASSPLAQLVFLDRV
jgi:surface protein